MVLSPNRSGSVRSDFGPMNTPSAATSTTDRIVIGDLITSIARSLGVESNCEDRVSGSEWLTKATFELMKFCKVEAECLCWIYLGNRLLLLPNVE